MNEQATQQDKMLAPPDKTKRLVTMAMLAAVSAVLVFLCFPLIPAAPFLKYDMADVPVLFAALTMGAGPGLLVLGIASAIQAFVFGHDGPIGFIMHMMASGTWLLVVCGVKALLRKAKGGLVIALVCGCLAWVLVMVPLNFIFTPKVMMDVPVGEAATLFLDALSGGFDPAAYSETAVNAFHTVKGLLWVGLVPFNLLKAGLNSTLFFLVYKSLKLFVKKK